MQHIRICAAYIQGGSKQNVPRDALQFLDNQWTFFLSEFYDLNGGGGWEIFQLQKTVDLDVFKNAKSI